MEVIGIKLQKAVLMMMSMVSMLGVSSCEDCLDSPRPSTGGDNTVEVSLCVGIADEVDAASLNAGSSGTKSVGAGDNRSFDVRLAPAAVQTKADALASAKPDQLYNLQILQYDSNNNFKALTTTLSQATGSTLTVGLAPCDNCQLIIVARGSSNAIPVFSGTPTWSNFQRTLANASTIKGIADGGIKNMPYFIHLKNVNVTNKGKIVIESADGSDARILLKRLAVRLTVNWKFDEGLRADYTLKEVKLCQVPTVYYLMPETEPDSRFEGDLYPGSLIEYEDLFRLKGSDAVREGSLTTWMPANAKGRSRSVTSEYYRTKEYAHASATYMEFVVDSKDGSERMYYRAYLGGKDVSDFNLLENTNYNYTLNIRNTDYRGDPRIQLLDQTPVISTNLVPTSNCFMMRPGTNICFNPYKHEAGVGGENTYLSEKTIGSVRVLWQSKDAGTSGDLVMGYAVSNEAGSYNHQNLVYYTDIDDRAKALVHVKVPVTQGGNAVIAAYAADGTTILWSWHIWITDYVPVGLKGTIDSGTRASAISAAQAATTKGAVQVYQGISWTDPTGSFYKCVIMDRNLGAIRAGIQGNQLDGVRTFGLLYQGGRKDPFFSTADGTTEEKKTIYDANGVRAIIERGSLKSLDALVRDPLIFCTDVSSYNASNNWNGDAPKTIHDPCPAGWRVPSNGVTPRPNEATSSSVADNTTKYCMMAGFGSTNTSLVYGVTPPTYNNVMYYNGTSIVKINKTSPVEKSTFVGSGFIYYGTQEGPDGDKSIFFPGVSLRERTNGDYRSSVENNSMFLWSSTASKVTTGHMQIYQIQGNALSFRHPIEWTFGFSVRCVQDNIQKK